MKNQTFLGNHYHSFAGPHCQSYQNQTYLQICYCYFPYYSHLLIAVVLVIILANYYHIHFIVRHFAGHTSCPIGSIVNFNHSCSDFSNLTSNNCLTVNTINYNHRFIDCIVAITNFIDRFNMNPWAPVDQRVNSH